MKNIIFLLLNSYFTLRFCRWTSRGDEGSGGEGDVGYNPLPAFINGRWERRIESILVDEIVVVDFILKSLIDCVVDDGY
jgi:hypothetical protein